jgi:hypothetical protein
MGALKSVAGERGQTIIMFAGIFTVLLIMGVVAVDFGLWLSERRGAQTDADLPALAGAAELTVLDPGPAEEAKAVDSTEKWLKWNDESGNASLAEPVLVDDSCFSDDPRDRPGVPDSVTVRVRHDTRTLFGRFFDMAVPVIGAHAKACAGSLWQAKGLFPIAVPMVGNNSDCFDKDADGNPIPIYGSTCGMAIPAGAGSSGETGTIRLFNEGELTCSDSTTGGGTTLRDEISAGGANTTCSIGDLVWPKTGAGGSQPNVKAIQDLLGKESQPGYVCDEQFGDGDGHDEFLEVLHQIGGDLWPSATAVFARNDCDSPRLVQLIIINTYDDKGNEPSPIIAFANFFIEGCDRVDTSGAVLESSNTCDIKGKQGQVRIRGQFVNILQTSGPIGPRNNFGTPAVALVE